MVVKHWNSLSRETVESPSLEMCKRYLVWDYGFSGEYGGAGLMVGLKDLRELFQPSCSTNTSSYIENNGKFNPFQELGKFLTSEFSAFMS